MDIQRRNFIKTSSLLAVAAAGSFPVLGNAFTHNQLADGSSFDFVIIGTGYGSAVTALRLAQQGKRCLMIEMGLDWGKSGKKFSSMAWAHKESTWLRNTTIAPFGNFRWFPKFTGALDRIDFEHVNIYAGRGVGGGSLVNGGMSVTPRKDYFEEIFPELDAETFYNTYFPRANKELGVSTIPEDYYQNSQYYQFSRTGEKEGVKAGYTPIRVPNVYDFDYMRKEEECTVTKSGLGGEVIYGNNHGKKDLTKTYIKQALATGKVTIIGLHKAEQIIERTDGSYDLVVSQINTSGKEIHRKTYNTTHLFLGAGSLGTTELLLRSKHKGTLPRVDDEVGKYWGNNGNIMAARDGVRNPLGMKQSCIPAAGLAKWTKDKKAVFAEIAPLPTGMDLRIALYLVINRVTKYGQLSFNPVTDTLDLDWNTQHNAHMVENAGRFLDEMSSTNGGWRSIIFKKGLAPHICYHPLGGCVLNKATDKFGRLNNHKGLYITDGSLIPASIGVNPYVTITAIAEYCIEHIIAEDFSKDTVDQSNNGRGQLYDKETSKSFFAQLLKLFGG